MHHDGSLNLDVIEAYVDWLRARDVTGVFICGTTGESMSLSVEERMRIAEHWARAVSGEFRLIVHVGHTCLADAQALAAHAAGVGADSIGCMPPSFFKPENIAAVVDWCGAVAATVPELPFYYYHIPSMTGVEFSIAAFLGEAGPAIPTLAGVKFTYEDLSDFSAAVRLEEGRYDVLFGRDQLLLQAFDAGAQGAVGSTYNFAGPLFQEMLRHRATEDRVEAVRLQELAVTMLHTIVSAGGSGIACLKATMAIAGFDCGPARRPLTNLTSIAVRSLQQKLNELDVDRLCRWRAAA